MRFERFASSLVVLLAVSPSLLTAQQNRASKRAGR